MSAQISPLKKAVDLIRKGQKDKARAILVEFLRAEPNNAQAWFLLSHTLSEPEKQQYALQQALRADPQFARAQQRLLELRGQAPQPKVTGPLPPVTAPPAPWAAAQVPSSPQGPSAKSVRKPSEPLLTSELLSGETEFAPQSQAPAPHRSNILRAIILLLVIVAVFGLIFLGSRQFFTGLLAGTTPQATSTQVQAFRTLPPTWTPTVALTNTPQANGAQSPQAALAIDPLDPQVLAQMETIKGQVSQLRGLSLKNAVENGIVGEDRETSVLSALYVDPVAKGLLANDARILAALGLLPANDSLDDYQLSQHADRYGGLYAAGLSRVYLFGADFSGLLPYVYARQIDQALLAQNFDLARLNSKELCLPFSDNCRALKAFAEGDVALLSKQWLNADAAAQTFQQVQVASPSAMLVETNPVSQFTLLDLTFPFERGASFVQTVFDVGGWQQVNTAYANPPGSTEQIMHPEKYFSGESAPSLVDPVLGDALGSEWTQFGGGNLGEWLTYLLLGRGENMNARLSDEQAAEAAAGWNGDQLQVYARKPDGVIALAEHWTMDSDADAAQLTEALRTQLGLRFAAAPTPMGSGTCWAAASQRACLFASGAQVLWLLGPDDATMQAMAALFPQFQ